MKEKKMSLGIFLLLGIGLSPGFAQQAILTNGGDATGNGGTVAYSIGQVIYTANTSGAISVSQGVQQGYDITTVGISTIEKNISLSVFPNPTTDDLKLEINETPGENFAYMLTDAQGKEIKTEVIKHNETHIEMKALANGIYFIQVNQENKLLKTFKVVKNQ